MTRVLSVASECAPLVKTGGLADVVGALPGAMKGAGVEMRTLLPGYRAVMAALEGGREIWRVADHFGGAARVLEGHARGLHLYVLDAPHLYDRGATLYLGPDGRDWPDNPQRFAALSLVAATLAAEGAAGWHPDILHLHDWQPGLAPIYLRQRQAAGRVGTVLTIHNIAFQGLAPRTLLEELRLPAAGFTSEGFEYWGQIGALKAGLVGADRLTTVSPTYARELMTPEFGMGLDGVLRARAGDLHGVLNGVDLVEWDPHVDPAIAHRYTTPKGKARNTAALREEAGLPQAEGPLCVLVSRLTEQKGIDLLLEALPALLAGGGQLAMLGSGNPELENAFRDVAARQPGVAVRIGYDEALAHRLIAGGEAILVPSRFEPCGLTQLYGLRYGTLPLVALTGGLADTVIPASPAGLRAGVATGLQFHPVNAASLADALTRLCALYRQPDVWTRLQKNAMRQPVGWDGSAADYAALYQELIDQP